MDGYAHLFAPTTFECVSFSLLFSCTQRVMEVFVFDECISFATFLRSHILSKLERCVSDNMVMLVDIKNDSRRLTSNRTFVPRDVLKGHLSEGLDYSCL